MLSFKQALTSSIGRKVLMGLSGLGLVGFVITHLAGNLTLLAPDSIVFNTYAKKLHDLGPLLEVAEIGLAFIFILHVVTAIQLKINHKTARPKGYAFQKSKGSPSFYGLASNNMAISGSILLVFLILHIWHFKFGPGMEAGYAVDIKGEQSRDLYRLVAESFKNPMIVGLYVFAMLFLGAHLRHGFWSAFQSLGAMNPRMTKPAYFLALLVAAALSVGFLLIPIFLYFNLGGCLK